MAKRLHTRLGCERSQVQFPELESIFMFPILMLLLYFVCFSPKIIINITFCNSFCNVSSFSILTANLRSIIRVSKYIPSIFTIYRFNTKAHALTSVGSVLPRYTSVILRLVCYVCCLHLKMEFCSCARGRQLCGIIHYY